MSLVNNAIFRVYSLDFRVDSLLRKDRSEKTRIPRETYAKHKKVFLPY